jgi:hypothetical protein
MMSHYMHEMGWHFQRVHTGYMAGMWNGVAVAAALNGGPGWILAAALVAVWIVVRSAWSPMGLSAVLMAALIGSPHVWAHDLTMAAPPLLALVIGRQPAAALAFIAIPYIGIATSSTAVHVVALICGFGGWLALADWKSCRMDPS